MASLLSASESALFFAQSRQDQRHALDVAGRVVAELGEHRDALRAALLHDVGKAHAMVGPVRRALATTLEAVGVPLRGRYAAYRRHGEIGARMLEAVDAGRLPVEFARHHPETPPAGSVPDLDGAVYAVLLAADKT